VGEPVPGAVPCTVRPCSDTCVALRFGVVSVHLRWEEYEAFLRVAWEVAAARRAWLGLPAPFPRGEWSDPEGA
jgi:hypothetical protein